MIKIIVHKSEPRSIPYTSKRTGQQATLRAQEAYAFTVNEQNEPAPFPEKFEILLRDGQPAYPVGEYQLHPSSLYLNREGKLVVAPRLVPLKKSA